jgi:hypothetical protein
MSLILVDLKFGMEQPGCPMCTLRAKSERRYIGSMLHEFVNDWESRRHIIASLGYCPKHIWQTGQMEVELQGSPLGNAIIYENLVRVAKERLALYADRVWEPQPPRRMGWLARICPHPNKLSPPEELRPQAQCRVCQCGETSARAHVHWLLQGLSDPEDDLRELYSQCDGLCLTHLRQAFEIATWEDRAGVEFLLANTFSRLDTLQHDLDEFRRKHAWEFRDEPKTEGEQNSWRRAMNFFGGNQGRECDD